MDMKNKEEIEKLKESHEKVFNDMKTKLTSDYNNQIEKLKSNNENTVKNLEEKHKLEYNKLKEKLEGEITKLTQNNKFEIEQLNKKYEAIIREKDEEISSHLILIKTLREEIDTLKSKKSELENEINSLKDQLEKIRSEIEGYQKAAIEAKDKYSKLSQDLEVQYKKKTDDLEKEFINKTDQFKLSQLEDLRGIKAEFQEALALMEKKNKIIVEKYQELKETFDKRPSREEDLENIGNLMEELKRNERLIKNFEGKVEFYKNELDIREENYNNKFNYKPNVGYYDPLKGNNQMTGNLNNIKRRPSEKKTSTNKIKSLNSLGLNAPSSGGIQK